MRIVHVCGSAPAGFMKGDEVHVLTLAGMQLARGESPVVISDRHAFLTDSCERGGIEVSIVSDLLTDPTSKTPVLVAKLKELNAEVLHCHAAEVTKAALEAADSVGIPFVVTLHVEAEELKDAVSAAARLGQKATVVAVAKRQLAAKRRFENTGIEIHYVPLGTKILPHEDRQRACEFFKPNLIMVGSVNFRKGVDIALLAMSDLQRRRGADCPTLDIYGNGRDDKYFIEMAQVLRLDNLVKFRGTEAGILERCSSSDVLIVPSRIETGPLVVLEAMSRGMPIVASDAGDVREMIPDRRYGRVVPFQSIMGFADAIDDILVDVASGRFDPGVVIERHRSEYSVDRMVDRIEAVYDSSLLAYRSAR